MTDHVSNQDTKLDQHILTLESSVRSEGEGVASLRVLPGRLSFKHDTTVTSSLSSSDGSGVGVPVLLDLSWSLPDSGSVEERLSACSSG